MKNNYTNDELALIWLSQPQGIAPIKKNEWLSRFATPEEMYLAFANNKEMFVKLVGEGNYIKLQEFHPKETIDAIISVYEKKGIKLVTMLSPLYPKSFECMSDPPPCLYCAGDVNLMENDFTIGVVGTRKVTRYGKDVTKKLVTEIAHFKFVVVSGLARGVDSIAHRVTLDCGGKTIAVLGNGLDRIYPSENTELAREIIKDGLIITEFPYGVAPFAYNFPQRNRLISGLSRAVLITESGMKSGTMITAECALNQGKEVMAVPGSILSESSEGTNYLIFNGATMVLTVNDIYDVYGIKDRKTAPTEIQLDFIEQGIVGELIEPKHFDEIMVKSGLTIDKLMPILLNLELCGVIRKLPGNFYSKAVN